MSTLRVTLAFLSCAAMVGCTGDQPAGADGGLACPALVDQGVACALPGSVTCLAAGSRDDCSVLASCHCEDGAFRCAEPDYDALCQGLPQASCRVEGTGSCDLPPAGGWCSCDESGAWRCVSACPDFCPLDPPAADLPCDDDSAVCRYGSVVCHCDDGTLRCT